MMNFDTTSQQKLTFLGIMFDMWFLVTLAPTLSSVCAKSSRLIFKDGTVLKGKGLYDPQFEINTKLLTGMDLY